MKKAGKRKKLNLRRKPFFMVISIILFLVMGSSFAWYLLSGQRQEADRRDIEIMTPYFLYLLNPGDKQSLQFSVGNIHPGEVKQVVICVSNQKPEDIVGENIDIAKESDFNYDLEFIYTENLALDYEVYELTQTEISEGEVAPDGSIVIEGVEGFYWSKKSSSDGLGENNSTIKSLTGVNVSNERWNAVFDTANEDILNGIQNKGQYLLFQKDATENELHLTYKNSKYEYDFYLIEMSWKENANFSDNAKETDLLYVVVNAKQPEPQLETD
ncbi:MAG: hypothetical protein IJA10_00750 [Lachnospiraceae bacterium]|nr:hypothetical protein [Lachnospiraceae bacterium]